MKYRPSYPPPQYDPVFQRRETDSIAQAINAPESVYRIADYGGRGGFADDTQAVQAAINAANAAGGGRVVGTHHTISSPLTLKTGVVIDGILPDFGLGAAPTYYRSSEGTIFRATTALNGLYLFDVTGAATWAIRNVQIEAPTYDWTLNTIGGIADVTNWCGPGEVDRVHFNGLGGPCIKFGSGVQHVTRCLSRYCGSHILWFYNYNGLAADGTSRYGSDNFVAWNDFGGVNQTTGDTIRVEGGGNNTIIGNQVFNCANGIRLTNNATNNRVEGNRSEKHNSNGILVDSGAPDANQIIGNQCFNNGVVGNDGVGINIARGARNLVLGNHCYLDTSTGLDGNASQTRPIVIAAAASDTLVLDNECETPLAGVGLRSSAPRTLIAGNRIHEAGHEGIYVDGADSHVIGNYVYQAGATTDNTYDGILLSAANCVATANVVRKGALANRVKYGLRISGAASGTKVGFNDTEGVTGNYQDDASDTQGMQAAGGIFGQDPGTTEMVRLGGSAANLLALYRPTSALQAAAGGVNFYAQDASGTVQRYGGLQGFIVTNTVGAADGGITIAVMASGTETNVWRFLKTGLTAVAVSATTVTPISQFAVYSVSLTPTTIATAAVQEVSFTVTGLVTADKVSVNHPVVSNNVVPASWRVQATDVLYGAFVNCSTATSSAAAAGTYKIIAIRS